MTPITEIGTAGSPDSNNTQQAQLIASVVAQQRVLAAQKGQKSGQSDTGTAQNKSAQQAKPDNKKEVEPQSGATDSAQAQSIVEAQSQKITAAFQSRKGIGELLSVIRDPEDRLLPMDPDDLPK